MCTRRAEAVLRGTGMTTFEAVNIDQWYSGAFSLSPATRHGQIAVLHAANGFTANSISRKMLKWDK